MRLALTWLTVLPLRGPASVDRAAAARAIGLAPVVGALLGLLVAGLGWLACEVGAAPSLAGVAVVVALAGLTRGMHLDGLSDTMDGLGCYGPPERAQQVLHDSAAGPFGVAAIVFAILAQSVAFGVLITAGRWPAIVLAVVAGRVAVVLACRRGVPAAGQRGFGPLVAGTQPILVGLGWAGLLAVGAIWVAPAPGQGPAVVLVALTGGLLLVRHCVRRFAGIGGDVLGAVLEVTVTLMAAGLGLGLAS